jgi:hypothetical protein
VALAEKVVRTEDETDGIETASKVSYNELLLSLRSNEVPIMMW